MQIRVRVTSATVTPSDSSGFIVEAEVADAEQFVDDILRRPDDGEDCWPLGKRYDEIVKEAHALRERVAELEAEIERMAETHNAASQSEHDVIREQLQRAEHERDDYRLRWEESQRQWGDRVDDCGDLAERLRRAEEERDEAQSTLDVRTGQLQAARERAEKAERERDEARRTANIRVGQLEMSRSHVIAQRARAEAGEALLRAVRGDLKETERYCFMPYDGETDLHGDVWKELRDERIEAIDAHLAAHSPDTAGGGEGV